MKRSSAHSPADASPPSPDTSSEIFAFDAEVKRKLLHLAALVLPAGVAYFGRLTALWVLVPTCVLAVGADALRTRHAPFRAFIRRVFGGMMRPDEWPPLGGPVVLNGATWMLLSVTLTTALFPARIAIPVLVIFMIADAVAALVGRTWGRTEWGATGRTVEGSLAFLAAGLLVMAAFPIPFGTGAVGVLVATTVEILPWPLNDNIRVPIAFGAALLVLETLA